MTYQGTLPNKNSNEPIFQAFEPSEMLFNLIHTFASYTPKTFKARNGKCHQIADMIIRKSPLALERSFRVTGWLKNVPKQNGEFVYHTWLEIATKQNTYVFCPVTLLCTTKEHYYKLYGAVPEQSRGWVDAAIDYRLLAS